MPKILVVDDEPDVEHLIRFGFRRMIRKGEIDFLFALNGVEALEKVEQDPDIDMVLTDINMPKMDGLTLLERLGRFDPMLKSVVVSAYGDMKNIRTAMNRGAFDFVTKPVDYDDLKQTVVKTLEHRQMIREVLEARDKSVATHRDLEVAADIQQANLAARFARDGAHEVSATMCPATDVVGDFYDFFQVAPDRLGFAVADVSGKGIPAALFMAVTRALLHASASFGLSPGPCLSRVNKLLYGDNDSGMSVTLFYGVLDLESGEVTYADGGHCAPYLVDGAGNVRALEATGGTALGVVDDMEYAEKSVIMGTGECLFLYSDGVTKAVDANGNEFGQARLLETLETAGTLEPSTLLAKIIDVVHDFAGSEEHSDDLTCMAIRRNDRAAADDHEALAAERSANGPGPAAQP